MGSPGLSGRLGRGFSFGLGFLAAAQFNARADSAAAVVLHSRRLRTDFGSCLNAPPSIDPIEKPQFVAPPRPLGRRKSAADRGLVARGVTVRACEWTPPNS
jgi:hypothetical protein